LVAQENRIVIYIVIPGPHESEEDATTETVLSSEAATAPISEKPRGSETKESGAGKVVLRERQRKAVVKSPALGESTIEWQVGDVIVLEGRDQLHLVRSGNLVSHEICLLSVVHRTERISGKEQEGNSMS